MAQISKSALAAIAALAVVALSAQAALAHASEQGFVLLLPTDVYIAAGGASVALTVVLLALLPPGAAEALFRTVRMWPASVALRHVTSCLAAVVLAFLVWRGFTGSRDPSVNPMPLFVWTVWWIGMVSVQGLIGNHWRWTNPWTGPAALLTKLTGSRAPWRYPRGLGHWPALVIFLLFAGFLLADPAPTDPARLAAYAGAYWYVALLGLVLFGPAWMVRAEGITVLMRIYARMGLLGRARGRVAAGLPGWQVISMKAPPLALAVFTLVLLGTGSFDGLNETFWWMGVLGVNPLEFPGRSAVIAQTLIGLVVCNLALIAAFAACLWLGERIAGTHRPLKQAFCLFAPSILPIALGYHVAHYLTAILVDGQYVAKALNDPLGNGTNLLGLGNFYVTTGFFNTPGTVKIIWLSQAGAVVIGHVIAILLAHALALRDTPGTRRAVLGQAPLAAFMVAYTVFGLWLLASPRGL
ncbi:hypothetical protein [Roseovarius indicus]|uniref:hypothetical protein n=1 Tax=Roseovarius indicus TaxID=540747 RepID=UPI0007D9E66F|nr:hypothetical protein [Roseovarius indicus]OAO05480.1 hypothetical protein A8B76_02445 [Roseovarius indicus]